MRRPLPQAPHAGRHVTSAYFEPNAGSRTRCPRPCASSRLERSAVTWRSQLEDWRRWIDVGGINAESRIAQACSLIGPNRLATPGALADYLDRRLRQPM